MSLLEEKEPSVSLKAIVLAVSFLTCAAFAGMLVFNGTHSATAAAQKHLVPAPAQTGAF